MMKELIFGGSGLVGDLEEQGEGPSLVSHMPYDSADLTAVPGQIHSH